MEAFSTTFSISKRWNPVEEEEKEVKKENKIYSRSNTCTFSEYVYSSGILFNFPRSISFFRVLSFEVIYREYKYYRWHQLNGTVTNV